MWVHERLVSTVDIFGSRAAVRAGDVRWSYDELDARSQTLAEQLSDYGVGPNSRVAIDLGQTAEAVAALWAVLRSGAAFACFDPTLPRPRLEAILEDLEPSALLTRAERQEEELRVPPGCRVLLKRDSNGDGSTFDLDLPPLRALLPEPGPNEQSLANLVYTSGSTGQPKGVMMSHRAMRAAMGSIAAYLRMDETDVVLNLLPLGFDYGLYQALLCAEVGAELILEPGVGYPGALLKKLRQCEVTTLPLVPSLLHMLLQRESFQCEELPHLRRFTNTGAHLAREDVRALRRRFPRADVFLMYGLTECKRVSYLPPGLVDTHPDSVGIPMPGCEVEIVDPEGRRLPAGEIGELVVRGPNLMSGYWRKPEATARALHPGPWEGEACLWSGDQFRRDAAGLLYFVGRHDDVFKSRGEKVAPLEVERALLAHATVADAAVLPVDDALLGKSIHAFISLATGEEFDRTRLKRSLTGQLEPHKIPHEFHVLDTLPRNERGKVDRAALISQLEASSSPGGTP